ncbi:LSU ribosomal protein L3p (L3e), partial [hydrothermal vent metagenome]
MAITLLGKKLGMTRVFSEDGKDSIPVTVIEMNPCVVTQIRTEETDGYCAVQIGWGEMKARNSTFQMIGHDAKAGTSPKRNHLETRLDDTAGYELGQEVGLDNFEGATFVDVSGISKGKGFAGGM